MEVVYKSILLSPIFGLFTLFPTIYDCYWFVNLVKTLVEMLITKLSGLFNDFLLFLNDLLNDFHENKLSFYVNYMSRKFSIK